MYIGQTSRSFEKRKKEHLSTSKNKNSSQFKYPFYRAIRKYKSSELVWEIIEEVVSLQELNEREKYWIAYYNSYIHASNSNGYNVLLGGSSHLGYIPSEETKKKISDSGSGVKNSNARLDEKDVEKILELIQLGYKQNLIAQMYNVKEPQISRIKHGKRWKSLKLSM